MQDPLLAFRTQALRFARDEDGSITVLTLFLFLLMLILAGVSVDMARHETARSRLQSVNDRAVLAAADLQQVYTADWDAEDVVRDYFQKAGLIDQLRDVEVVETINSRTVTAQASLGINTFFMRLVGVDSLVVPAAGAAEESVSDMEVVMALDVSGSMVDNGSTRLADLKGAAGDFVQMVLESDDAEDDPRISIAMVPFNGQVNLGPRLAARYAIQHAVTNPANVHCVDLPLGVYSTQTISTTDPLPATAWADTYSSVTRDGTYRAYATTGQPDAGNRWCQNIPGNFVRLPSHSVDDLQDTIDGLVGEGATSINAGMRWAMTLLDPNAQGVYNALITSGDIPNDFADPPDNDTRPFAYRRPNTSKIIVLMTDGQNWEEERVNPDYKSGNSPIWRRNSGGNREYSIFFESKVNRRGGAGGLAGSRPFWVPHLAAWHARPWNGIVPPGTMPYTEGTNRRMDINNDGVCNNADDNRGPAQSNQACWSNATLQIWPMVWTELRMTWVAYQLYARSGVVGYDTQMNLFRTRTATGPATNASTMDGQLTSMCNLARQNGVTVYTIAFEAPEAVEPLLQSCASNPGMFFETDTDRIDTTFQQIAANIISLRLTQ